MHLSKVASKNASSSSVVTLPLYEDTHMLTLWCAIVPLNIVVMLSPRKEPQQQFFSRLFLITDFLIIDFLNFLTTLSDDDLLILETEELFTTDIVDCMNEMFLNCLVIDMNHCSLSFVRLFHFFVTSCLIDIRRFLYLIAELHLNYFTWRWILRGFSCPN